MDALLSLDVFDIDEAISKIDWISFIAKVLSPFLTKIPDEVRNSLRMNLTKLPFDHFHALEKPFVTPLITSEETKTNMFLDKVAVLAILVQAIVPATNDLTEHVHQATGRAYSYCICF
jgi:hypothetical protein